MKLKGIAILLTFRKAHGFFLILLIYLERTEEIHTDTNIRNEDHESPEISIIPS